MDKMVRIVRDPRAIKAEDYRYWQSVSPAERMQAAWQMSLMAYRMKGLVPDAQELYRSVARIKLSKTGTNR